MTQTNEIRESLETLFTTCGTYVTTGCEKPSHGRCECCEEHCQCHATTIGIVTCPQCPAKRTRRSAGAAAVRRTKRLEERCHVIEERILPRLKDKNEGKAQYYRAQLSAIRWALKELERLTAERDAARAAARELGQALNRIMPMAQDCNHAHFSDLRGNEDTKLEALLYAAGIIAKHAEFVKEPT